MIDFIKELAQFIFAIGATLAGSSMGGLLSCAFTLIAPLFFVWPLMEHFRARADKSAIIAPEHSQAAYAIEHGIREENITHVKTSCFGWLVLTVAKIAATVIFLLYCGAWIYIAIVPGMEWAALGLFAATGIIGLLALTRI